MELMGMHISSLPHELNQGGFSGRSASVDESVQSQSLRRNAKRSNLPLFHQTATWHFTAEHAKLLSSGSAPKKGCRIGMATDFAMHPAFDNGDNIG